MAADEESAVNARPGSYADLARRMDKIEDRHSSLEKTVERVELNQKHDGELAKLRFDALDSGLAASRGQLSDFMKRIEGIISGEITLPSMRQGQELVADYTRWRATVEDRLAPDGQSIKKALEEHDEKIAAAEKVAETAAAEGAKNRQWIAYAGGVVGTLVILLNLFAPAIRHFLGLP